MDYRYSYPTYTPTCNYPLTSKQGFHGIMETNLLLGPADAVVKHAHHVRGSKRQEPYLGDNHSRLTSAPGLSSFH